MRHIIKTSFILATIVLGAVFAQTPVQNSATVNGSQLPPPQTGTNTNQPQGSGQNPSGSGVMRSGNAPQGPSNLPPQEPGITDKLAAITDNRLVSLKKILQYLPPVEQDLIAGKKSFFFVICFFFVKVFCYFFFSFYQLFVLMLESFLFSCFLFSCFSFSLRFRKFLNFLNSLNLNIFGCYCQLFSKIIKN
jgi:hypothetical protein